MNTNNVWDKKTKPSSVEEMLGLIEDYALYKDNIDIGPSLEQVQKALEYLVAWKATNAYQFG
jgi:hypothetical protein